MRDVRQCPTHAANDAPTPLLINGNAHAWRAGMTVADAVRERGDDDAAVATAVNGEFVARQSRARTRLEAGDTLLVFAAIVGG